MGKSEKEVGQWLARGGGGTREEVVKMLVIESEERKKSNHYGQKSWLERERGMRRSEKDLKSGNRD